MMKRFRDVFSSKNNTNPYAHLPEQIQAEIKAADEATSVYDIR